MPKRDNGEPVLVHRNIKLREGLAELMEELRLEACKTGYVPQWRMYSEAIEQYLQSKGMDTAITSNGYNPPPSKPVKVVKRSRRAAQGAA